MLDTHEINFNDALEWLAAREGDDLLLLLSGPTDQSPVSVRLSGLLGPLQVIDENSWDDSQPATGTASFPVGDALISMFGPDVRRCEVVDDAGWLIVYQQHSVLEWRPNQTLAKSCPRCGDTTPLIGWPMGIWVKKYGGDFFEDDEVPAICGDCCAADSARKEHAYAMFSAEGVFPLPPVAEWDFDAPGAPIPPDRWPIGHEKIKFERSDTFRNELHRLYEEAVERRQGGQHPIT
jgi:hypothetical protein